MMTLGYSFSVIRAGQVVLTNEASEGDLFPGFGAYDPVLYRKGVGTYEDFVTEYARVRTPTRAADLQGPNYSL